MSVRLKKILWYLELVPKLGILDVAYVSYYRFLIKTGLLNAKFPVSEFSEAFSFFKKGEIVENLNASWKEELLLRADKISGGELLYYSYHWINQSKPPNWFINPFNNKVSTDNCRKWTEITDFDNKFGDIKNIWEASRFTWAGILARAYSVTGNEKYLNTLNFWLSDWMKRNPVNQGPNWKCGQEASFRVLNLLNVSYILKQSEAPSKILIEIIGRHLERISANTRYALAQRNNHATSESAALFIGGNWLACIDTVNRKKNLVYAKKGRDALEKLVRNLVYEDGSFAQHSINYHRLFLDTLTLVIFWNQKFNLPAFSHEFVRIAGKSVDWLLSVIDISGRCPNLGANDGTMLQSNHSCDYRDFRPSLQTASVLIKGHLLFEDGPWDESLFWFNIRKDDYKLAEPSKQSKVHESGYSIMVGDKSWALLRYPYYKFRPTHNDVFHFDLWANGRNILFDSGTFSYNPDKKSEIPDFASVQAHNSLSFENREPMPRLGRFLLAKWIKPNTIGDIFHSEDGSDNWEGLYKTSNGNSHFRSVKWRNDNWVVYDKFSGKAGFVEAGFNFERCNYILKKETNTLLVPWGQIAVSGNILRIKVVEQVRSDYYMQYSSEYRLIIESQNNSEITTSISLH